MLVSGIAINLVGGGEQQVGILPVLPGCLQNVERPAEVHFEVQPGIHQRGGHRNLCREVIDFSGVPHHTAHHGGVTNVPHRDLQSPGAACHFLQVLQVVAGALS